MTHYFTTPVPQRRSPHEDRELYLGQSGVLPNQGSAPPGPLYAKPEEALAVIQSRIEEQTGSRLDPITAVESGIVQEYVMVEKGRAGPKLLFRVWPLLFHFNPRIEYKIYPQGRPFESIIVQYLEICAKINQAPLEARPV